MQGARKTKLGLREFVSLGDFEQQINVEEQHAVSGNPAVCAAVLLPGGAQQTESDERSLLNSLGRKPA